MKKVNTILLSAILCLSLTGCGNISNIYASNEAIEIAHAEAIENNSDSTGGSLTETLSDDSRDIFDETKYEQVTFEPIEEVLEIEEDIPVIENYELSMVCVGDNLIHSGVYKNACLDDGSYNFDFIFDNVKDDIASYDLAVINQETIYVNDYSMVSSYPCFGTPSSMAESVYDAGFDIVLNATNHTFDKRETGINDTLSYWEENHPDITLLGIHPNEEDFNQIDIVEKDGIKIAMFNYTYGLNGFVLPSDKPYLVNLLDYKDKFISDLNEAENLADLSICFLHIGNEYVYEPTTYQVNYINDLIDAGADIVICAHPHVVEPYDIITTENNNSALVYYSCGNFVSHQDEVPRLLGGMASFIIDKEVTRGTVTKVSVKEANFTPLVTHYDGTTHTVYKLSEYNDELSSKHLIRRKDSSFGVDKLNSLWNQIVGDKENLYLDIK